MPNWTRNIVKLKGSEQDIQSIKNLIFSVDDDGETFFDFNNVIPMPEDYELDDRWYDWSIENWGTKWNAKETYIETDTPTELEICFMTAWSHPGNILSKLNDMFKEVEFYHEAQHEGGFGGHIALFDPTQQKWSFQQTTETLVGENGKPVDENEDTGEFVDEDGNIHEYVEYIFEPVYSRKFVTTNINEYF